MDIDIVNQNLVKSNLQKARNKAETSADRASKEKQLKEAAAGFESILIHNMLKSMRSTLPGDALFPESNTMNIYQSMYDQYLAETLSAQNSSIGIGEFLYQQLKDSV